MTTRCGRCKTEKPDEDFPPHELKRIATKRSACCRACAAARHQAYKARAGDRIRDLARAAALKRGPRVKRPRTPGEAEAQWKRLLFSKFGLTPEQYAERLVNQGGGCAVCGALPGSLKYRFAVDHDHDTGEIRGILCGNCNRGIGYLGDTLEGVERAVRYLRQMSDSTIDRVQ